MATDAEKSRDWITTAGYILGFGIVAFIVFEVVGSFDTILKQAGAAATSATGAASNTVQSGAGIWNDFLGMLGFSSTDPTQIPGYKVGNWQILLSRGAGNPMSPGYTPADSSVITPGPTALTANYITPLDNEFSSWFNINTDKVLTLFQEMPSQDIVNLVWKYENEFNDTDMAAEIAQLGNDQFKDAIATVIMSKPISI